MSVSPFDQYHTAILKVLRRIGDEQRNNISLAADVCAGAILKGRLVHLFGAGHSRIPVEEIFPRYGSFPGFHPIVELSMTNHHQVVGANGQRQAMTIENMSGLAEIILRNFVVTADDAMLVFSVGGSNVVPVEMAMEARKVGMTTIGVTSVESNRVGTPKQRDGKMLADVCDIVIDNCVPPGDAVVWIDGMTNTPVSPVSSVAGCFIANALKGEIADRLAKAGEKPLVLTSPVHVGAERSAALFNETYDDYRRRVGVLYR